MQTKTRSCLSFMHIVASDGSLDNQQFSSHLKSIKYITVIFIPELTTPNTAKLHLNLVADCIEKSLPFIGAGDKQRNVWFHLDIMSIVIKIRGHKSNLLL